MPDAHSLRAAEALTFFGVEAEQGLSSQQAQQRLAQHGPNELAEAPAEPAWRKFFRQFRELVILILIAAAMIAGALGEWADSLAILAIVLINGIISFLQEHRAERAMAALRKMTTPTARVIRQGELQIVPTSELVPGDVIQLEAGDHVPADCRLLHGFGLRTQEAALTGESSPEDKDPQAVVDARAPLGDRKNMVYLGTVVAAGKATAIVIATGMRTELGRIAGLIQRAEPKPTPLQRRLSELGRLLLVVVFAVIAVVFTLHMLRGGATIEVFMLSVSLAVAAVPEGLPAVVTLALALGLHRMVKRNALIRRLPSVETLGSVTVICSDKTGTLTRNEMTVREVALRNGRFHVTGVGYAPVGIFLAADELLAVDPRQEQDLHFALSIGAWCNNARVLPTRSGADWQVIGDPTEGALLVAAMKAGTVAIDRGRHVVFEVPFDSERKMMTVVVQGMDQRRMMYSKGAPEVILERCLTERSRGAALPLTDARRQEIRESAAEMAARALRVLALAYRALPHGSTGSYEEAGLTFAALVGMLDPPREEAKQAVRICHQAGIRPVMITGDHPTTAQAIARELGIVGESDLVETGQQLDTLDEEELLRQVDRIAVYARVAAEHKMRVVDALKRRGHIVAMTGDGVNDAPAIKSADIGIAMGITGSDVTREAADMVLLDDNFASIVNAVEEGRAIYDNIQKVVLYLLSSNSSEVLLVFLAAVLGWPAPLLAVQLLWINLVSDGFPALALGVEPPERDVMRRRPQQPHQPVISWARGARMFAYGSLMAAVGLIGFATVYRQDAANLPEARTVAFCVLAFTQLFFAVSCRSERYTLPELGLLSNPHLIAALMVSALLQLSVVSLPFAQPIFEVATNLPPSRWGLILALALVPVTVVEVAKLALGWARSR